MLKTWRSLQIVLLLALLVPVHSPAHALTPVPQTITISAEEEAAAVAELDAAEAAAARPTIRELIAARDAEWKADQVDLKLEASERRRVQALIKALPKTSLPAHQFDFGSKRITWDDGHGGTAALAYVETAREDRPEADDHFEPKTAFTCELWFRGAEWVHVWTRDEQFDCDNGITARLTRKGNAIVAASDGGGCGEGSSTQLYRVGWSSATGDVALLNEGAGTNSGDYVNEQNEIANDVDYPKWYYEPASNHAISKAMDECASAGALDVEPFKTIIDLCFRPRQMHAPERIQKRAQKVAEVTAARVGRDAAQAREEKQAQARAKQAKRHTKSGIAALKKQEIGGMHLGMKRRQVLKACRNASVEKRTNRTVICKHLVQNGTVDLSVIVLFRRGRASSIMATMSTAHRDQPHVIRGAYKDTVRDWVKMYGSQGAVDHNGFTRWTIDAMHGRQVSTMFGGPASLLTYSVWSDGGPEATRGRQARR